jgi:hypothetical protein
LIIINNNNNNFLIEESSFNNKNSSCYCGHTVNFAFGNGIRESGRPLWNYFTRRTEDGVECVRVVYTPFINRGYIFYIKGKFWGTPSVDTTEPISDDDAA